MEELIKDFFNKWEEEIAAYHDVVDVLTLQKNSLSKWEIQEFQKITQKAALTISKAHKCTNERNYLMESYFVLKGLSVDKYSLKNIDEVFDEIELKEKSMIFFDLFSTTLKKIDRLSYENKTLIGTGLELVSDNLEIIADIIDRDRVYSRVGMINPKRSSLILNKRV